MRTLWASSARHGLRHPAQLALAIGGLALGVATVVAVDLATASARRAFALSLDAVQGSATHELGGGPAGIDERYYAALRRRGGPIEAAPLVEGYAVVGGRTLQIIGLDPFADPGFRRGQGLAASAARTQAVARSEPPASEGQAAGQGPAARSEPPASEVSDLSRWLLEPGAFALAPRTAAELGLEPGALTQIAIAGRSHPARLVALLGSSGSGADALLVTDIAHAQEWLGLRGRLSRVHLRVPEGEAGERALAALRAELVPGLWLSEAQRRTRTSLDMTAAFTTNLEAMSLLSLWVAVFLIYGAISFAVLQRRRTLGILRGLGATRAEIFRLVLAEAAIAGLAGTALGVAAGVAIGRELIALVTRTINDLYFVVAVNEIALEPAAIAKAVLAGLGVALAAAAIPAAEVARSAPQLGLRRSVLESRAQRVAHWLVPASAGLALGAGALVLLSRRSLAAGLVALFMLLFAVALLSPAALRTLARSAGVLLASASPIARLALSDVARSLSRTGVAVAALGMAIAAVISVGVMVDSFRESLRDWLEVTLRADIYVSAPGPGFGRPERQLEPELVAAILSDPEIAEHSAARRVQVDSPRGPVIVDAFELGPEGRAGFELTRGDPQAAWEAVARGSALVSEPLAWRLELEPGDALELSTGDGPHAFPIAGVYREYGNDRGTALLDRAHYARLFRDPAITSLALHLRPAADPEAAIARIRAASRGRQQILARANAGIRELSFAIFERTFTITRVLYWLAAGVAALGLLGALLAWELERTRELALLRALGLTPIGVGAMLGLQTAFMGLAAWLAATPAGLLAAALLVHVVNRRAFGWRIDLHVAPGQIAAGLELALVAALAAGVIPAWRAARAPLAQAVREE
jgi:putative ABC transport system permease protein